MGETDHAHRVQLDLGGPNGNVDENMMAVHVGHFVRLLEPHFEKVEVLRYPLFAPGFVSRKAVVATGDAPPARRAPPRWSGSPSPRTPTTFAAAEAALAEERRVAEEAEAARAVADTAQRAAEAETQREMERLQAESLAAREDERAAREAELAAQEALHTAEFAARAAEAHWEAERTDLRSIVDGTEKRVEAAELALEPALRSPDAVLTGPLVRELAHRVADGRLLRAATRKISSLVRRG